MSKKILSLLRFSGLSVVMFISISRIGNCITDCGTLDTLCFNNGNIKCSAFTDPQFYDPGEKRTDIMQNAADACLYNQDPDSERCNRGTNIIMDAKDPPMCTR